MTPSQVVFRSPLVRPPESRPEVDPGRVGAGLIALPAVSVLEGKYHEPDHAHTLLTLIMPGEPLEATLPWPLSSARTRTSKEQ